PVLGGSTFHYGLDQAVPDGTPIYAVASGTVASVVAPRGGAAGYLSVRSVIDGKVTYIGYVHMWKPGTYVKVGQAVSVGQHIADVGASGPATGPHLHLEVWKNAFYGSGTAVDPAKWLAQQNLPVVSLAKAYRAAAAPKKCTYYSTANLRVRTGPSTSTKILTTVKANTTLANKPGVKLNRFIPVTVTVKGKKITGWVSSDYISQHKTYSLAKKTVVRTRAASTAKHVATVAKGRQVTLLGRSGKWSHVRVAGHTGWAPTTSVRAGL
ncbi:MAG TPA: peptidoglycan DD-metalloendopeptidase family protein, partial [Cellulomonas sp.]|nr:peptidoglycan DD-metalloendopeptidase family protein [Cellulomonas sp.]